MTLSTRARNLTDEGVGRAEEAQDNKDYRRHSFFTFEFKKKTGGNDQNNTRTGMSAFAIYREI